MHGLGNDFIIFDNIKNAIIHQPDFVQRMSNRRIGVGCDQLMIIENTSIKENFKVKMYNSDGSETGACGNGVRCVADYLMEKENIDNLYVETISGKLECKKDKLDVTVNMGRPRFEWNEIPLAKKQNTQKVFLNDFEVILAFTSIIGVLFFFAFKIKFGQISESTKKITSGFHICKNLLIKKFTSKGKNLWYALSNCFNWSTAKFPELKVVVVIKNSRLLFSLFNSSIRGKMLLNSPILAA